jgi:hypothetical protein
MKRIVIFFKHNNTSHPRETSANHRLRNSGPLNSSAHRISAAGCVSSELDPKHRISGSNGGSDVEFYLGGSKQRAACFMLGLFFSSEDGDDMFLRNIG